MRRYALYRMPILVIYDIIYTDQQRVTVGYFTLLVPMTTSRQSYQIHPMGCDVIHETERDAKRKGQTRLFKNILHSLMFDFRF